MFNKIIIIYPSKLFGASAIVKTDITMYKQFNKHFV